MKDASSDYKFFQRITSKGLVNIPDDTVIVIRDKDVEEEKQYQVVRDDRKLYQFDGSILQFGKPVGYFKESTLAISEKKARNNLIYRAKKKLGLSAEAGGISLKGNLIEIPRDRQNRG